MKILIRKINPVENIAVAVVAMGEGWHNYHVRCLPTLKVLKTKN